MALAHRLAEVAATTALQLLKAGGFATRSKSDGTPVTDVDEAVEDAIRSALSAERPEDAMLGEERGLTGESSRRWIVDAIDGTANLAVGSPLWGTLIALEEDGELVVGLLSAPLFGRRWWAARGAGAWRTKDVAAWEHHGQRLKVSTETSIRNAHAAVLPDSAGVVPDAVAQSVRGTCAVQDVAGHPALLVAQGELDLSVHLGGGPWDHAALAVIVEEAGGAFSDLRGERRVDTGSVVFSNGHLHEEALALLGGTA